MEWHRVRAKDKLAFREDLQQDPTLSDLAKRMISVIAQHWDNSRMTAECSLSFIATGAGTTKKMVNKYAGALAASGRVFVLNPATYTTSTHYAVNWFYRASAWVRQANGGPILDCRPSPDVSLGESPVAAQEAVPQICAGESPSDAGGSPPTGGPIPSPKEKYTAAPGGAGTGVPARGAAEERREQPHKVESGFSKWRIVHAEYEGDDIFVAHLRSGSGRKFVLRCNVGSETYDSLDKALSIDGEAEYLRGKMVQMSTNRTGEKSFMRAAPVQWSTATVLSGDSTESGASIRMHFHEFGNDGPMHLDADNAQRLALACGGQDETIGAMIRYRLMPDDTIEFRRVVP